MKSMIIENMADDLHRWLRNRAAARQSAAEVEAPRILQDTAAAETVESFDESLNGACAAASSAHDDLDSLAGTWTTEMAAEFDRNTAEFRRIDDDMWT